MMEIVWIKPVLFVAGVYCLLKAFIGGLMMFYVSQTTEGFEKTIDYLERLKENVTNAKDGLALKEVVNNTRNPLTFDITITVNDIPIEHQFTYDLYKSVPVIQTILEDNDVCIKHDVYSALQIKASLQLQEAITELKNVYQ